MGVRQRSVAVAGALPYFPLDQVSSAHLDRRRESAPVPPLLPPRRPRHTRAAHLLCSLCFLAETNFCYGNQDKVPRQSEVIGRSVTVGGHEEWWLWDSHGN